MAQTRAYYGQGSLSAAFFDLLTSRDPAVAGDVDLYAGLAPAGGRILELGAGSGRVTFALAARGFRVTGIDIAPAMLAQAQAQLATLDADVAARVRLKLGDMTALRLDELFDAVVCPFFTLAHVPAGTAWRHTFAVAARHLERGGRAAFHLPALEVIAALPPIDPDALVLDQPLPGGGRLQLTVQSRSWKPAIGRFDQVIGYRVTDAAGVRRSAERLTYYVADPAPYAAAAGLEADGEPLALGEAGRVHLFRKA